MDLSDSKPVPIQTAEKESEFWEVRAKEEWDAKKALEDLRYFGDILHISDLSLKQWLYLSSGVQVITRQ
jgi:hypothetical protein